MSATRYVDMISVVANRCTTPPVGAGDSSARVLVTTTQFSGAVTVSVYRALRSGWSKHANTRLASAVSNCE